MAGEGLQGRWRTAVPIRAVADTQPSGVGAWVLHPAPIEGLRSWTITAVPDPYYVFDLTIRGDHLLLYTRVGNGQSIWQSWDFAGQRETALPLEGRWSEISPDGQTLVKRHPNTVALHDAASPEKPRVTLIIPLRRSIDADFSPDGSTLATVNHDNDVLSFWDVKKGKKINDVSGRMSDLADVAWSPDGKRVACVVPAEGGGDALCLAEPGKNEPTHLWKLELSLRRPVPYWAPDGKRIVISSSRSLVLFELEEEQLLVLDVGEPLSAPAEVQYSHHGYYKKPVTRAFGWSPDGKRVALNAQDLSVLVWDLEAQKVVHRFKGHTRPVVSLLFLPDNHTLVSASSDYTVRFWNLDTGQPRGTIVPITGPANRRVLAAFSVDGHYSISPGHEPSLKYIVEDRNGVRMDKEPGEFFTEFNWVNDPKQVRLDGREH